MEAVAPAKATSVLMALVMASGLFHRGMDRYARGKFDEAVNVFQRMVRVYPDTSVTDDAQYWLGRALWKAGRTDDARKAFQVVVDRYPNSDLMPAARVGLAFLGGAWEGLDLVPVGPWDQVVLTTPECAVASYFLAGRQGNVEDLMGCLAKSARAPLEAALLRERTPAGRARIANEIRKGFARWRRFRIGSVRRFANDPTRATVEVVHTGADGRSAVRPMPVRKEAARWLLANAL